MILVSFSSSHKKSEPGGAMLKSTTVSEEAVPESVIATESRKLCRLGKIAAWAIPTLSVGKFENISFECGEAQNVSEFIFRVHSTACNARRRGIAQHCMPHQADETIGGR
jgi:hypothetical protein